MGIFQVLLFLLVFGPLLFLAMIVTRYIGAKAQNAMRGKYINVVETVSLGMEKRIHLVKVGTQYVLIASCGKNIEFLTNVSLDENIDGELSAGKVEATDFSTVFSKYANTFKDIKMKRVKNAADIPDIDQSGDVFRTNLDKLKDITREADKIVR